MTVFKAPIVPEPSFVYEALVSLPIFVLTTVPSVPGRTSFSYTQDTSFHAPRPKSSCQGMPQTISVADALPPLCVSIYISLLWCGTHTHTWTLELKPYLISVTIGTLGSDIRMFHTQCFNLITFLVDAEHEARYGLPRCPTFRMVFCVAFYGLY